MTKIMLRKTEMRNKELVRDENPDVHFGQISFLRRTSF